MTGVVAYWRCRDEWSGVYKRCGCVNPEDGRRRLRRGGFASRAAAEQARAYWLGSDVDPGLSLVTLGQWLDIWSETRQTLRPATRRTVGRVQAMFTALLWVNAKRAHPLAPATFQRIREVLRAALNGAIRRGPPAFAEESSVRKHGVRRLPGPTVATPRAHRSALVSPSAPPGTRTPNPLVTSRRSRTSPRRPIGEASQIAVPPTSLKKLSSATVKSTSPAVEHSLDAAAPESRRKARLSVRSSPSSSGSCSRVRPGRCRPGRSSLRSFRTLSFAEGADLGGPFVVLGSSAEEHEVRSGFPDVELRPRAPLRGQGTQDPIGLGCGANRCPGPCAGTVPVSDSLKRRGPAKGAPVPNSSRTRSVAASRTVMEPLPRVTM